jgi:hypothetical protein
MKYYDCVSELVLWINRMQSGCALLYWLMWFVRLYPNLHMVCPALP